MREKRIERCASGTRQQRAVARLLRHLTTAIVGSAFASAAGAAGPVAGAANAPPVPDASAPARSVRLLDADHPLVGRVWSVREARFVPESELHARARAVRYLLIGERHGNPEHHAGQGRLIVAVAGGRPVTVVAEQLDFPQQPAIDECARTCTDFGRELGGRVDWERSGWPDYALYAPVFAAAGQVGATVRAGNPGARRVRALAAGAAAEGAEARWLPRAREALDATGRERLVESLVAGHCGHLPAERTGPLVFAQRIRDAALAATLEGVAPDALAVLVAGTGHVRRDYGVPTLLGAGAALVVGFAEVDPRRTDPAQYATAGAFDYLWFTARVDEPDPCEQFRESLERLRKPAKRAGTADDGASATAPAGSAPAPR